MNILGRILLLAMCVAVETADAAAAAKIELKDGSIIKGVVTSSSNGTCIISRTGGAAFSLNCAEIARIDPPPPPPLPTYLPESPQLSVAGSNTIGAKLMPALLIDYAKSKGASATPEIPRVIGSEEVSIEPLPAIPSLWTSIEVSAHGSATGFHSLAALAAFRQSDDASKHSPDASANGQNSGEEAIRVETANLWKGMEANVNDNVAGIQGGGASSGGGANGKSGNVSRQNVIAISHPGSNIAVSSINGSAMGIHRSAEQVVARQSDGAGKDAPANGQSSVDEATRLETAYLLEANANGSVAGSQDASVPAVNRQPDDVSKHNLIAFANGQAPTDIAMSSRRITPAEVKMLSSLGQLDNPHSEHVIALDGLAIVINRANRVETLSKEQIRQIFTGKITDWDQVGGWPGPIVRYARDDRSGTFDTFKDVVLKGVAMSPDVIRIEDSRELSSMVAKDPRAIGFIGMSYIGEAKAVNIHECNLDYPPTIFNAKTEEYPLSRRLFLYAPERRSKGIDEFLNYTNTPSAQRIVAKSGFVDLSIEPDFTGDQRRLRQATYPGRKQHSHDTDLYGDMLRDGGRLSITLRFRTNSADLNKLDLDSRAIHDLQRLKQYMHGPLGVGHRVRLVGFTDADGDYKRNQILSFSRANAIANELKDIPLSGILGLGPSFSVACNDTDEGKAKNRRVEVWMTK
ncbi:MAG: phosphate ABC transporter substrate-binding/OmpA family protein [Burkholderiales bacterium]